MPCLVLTTGRLDAIVAILWSCPEGPQRLVAGSHHTTGVEGRTVPNAVRGEDDAVQRAIAHSWGQSYTSLRQPRSEYIVVTTSNSRLL